MVVAKDREASSLSEFSHLPQQVIICVLGYDDSRRVRGTHCVVSVHSAQSPLVMLQTEKRAMMRVLLGLWLLVERV